VKTLGLTGGISSGKSTVCHYFKKLGAFIIDADLITHEIYENNTEIQNKILQAFGSKILNSKSKKIDRKILSKIVFQEAQKRKILENILHPAIGQKIQSEIEKAKKGGVKLCLVEAALLVETGSYKNYDALIVVKATPAQQIERLKKYKRLEEDEAKQRLAAQLSLEEKLKLATYVIDNSHSLENTQKQVQALYEKLTI